MTTASEPLGWHSLGVTFDCDCGITHSLPIETCYIGEGAAGVLARFAQERCGERCLALSDENTREAGGEALLSALGAHHKTIRERILPARDLDATEERGEAVAREGEEVDFYVAVGAGTISDLAKYAGDRQGKPVLLFPTAASMNGYASAIVALKVRGLKRTMPCQPATGIFADPAVVATAPQRMLAAGVADFLSKCSSAADWRAAHLLRGDYYCHRPREFNEGIQERLLAQAPAIGRGEPEGVRLVLEALMLSGFGMVIAGSSAPASGGEHLLSHYLDMKHALHGCANDLHGTQVGVATVYTLGLWEAILNCNADSLDINALVVAHPEPETVQARIQADWGAEVGAEVWAQWTQKAPDPEQLRGQLQAFQRQLPALRTALQADLLPAKTVARCIEACGGPTTPEAMAADTDSFHEAVARARYLRNRYTVLDLAAELGLAPA